MAVFMVLVKVMADLFGSKACLTSRGNFVRLIFLVCSCISGCIYGFS